MPSQPNPPTAPAFRYRFIDALRGIAALAVVGFHAKAGHHIDALCDAMPPLVSTLLGRGDLGVEVFFVVSGFVLAHSMADTDVDLRYVGRFLLRRSVRLDPPYWASMVLVVALGLLSNRFVPGKAFAPPGAGRVLAHVLYLQDLLGVPPLNSIYWTLCIEIQFYLAFALLMLVATALRRRGLSVDRAFYAVILPAALIADLWPLGLAPFEVRGLFVSRFHLFVAGVVVWWAVVPRRGDRPATVLGAGSVVLLATAAAVRGDVALGAGAATAAAILVAGTLRKLATWLSARPLQFLGAISYSLYLVHNPVTGALFRAGYRLTGDTVALEATWLGLVLGLCVALAYAFHRAVERPSLALSRRIALRARRGSR
jgi:peptidoglycan/LPS O-acetylase OafA/YrhL